MNVSVLASYETTHMAMGKGIEQKNHQPFLKKCGCSGQQATICCSLDTDPKDPHVKGLHCALEKVEPTGSEGYH